MSMPPPVINDPLQHMQKPPDGAGMPPGMPDAAAAAMSAANVGSMPEVGSVRTTVELATGYISPVNGVLVTKAEVRELNGYDEERLARFDLQKNFVTYVSEMLMGAVTDFNGGPITREILQNLLIGDRESLLLGIRQATYGDLITFNINCGQCETTSEIEIDLTDDVKIRHLDDPLVRTFDFSISSGKVKVALLTGLAQEAFGDNFAKKTVAEINSIMLAKSVIEINGVPTNGQLDPVRGLSVVDRASLIDYINEIQPGPQFGEIPVNCATCGEEYPITLGIPNLFRF